MRWVYETDSDRRWMVYDEDEPDTAPVVCRGVRSEKHAKLLASTPDLLAALQGFVAAVEAEGDTALYAAQYRAARTALVMAEGEG